MSDNKEVKYIDQLPEMQIPDKFQMIKKAFAKAGTKSNGSIASIDATKLKDTSSTYSRDTILQALSTTDETGNNIKTLVQASRWLYKRSGEYRQLIHRFAGIHKYRYVVMPKLAIEGDVTDAYTTLGDYCMNADIENTCLDITIKALVDGTAYTYETIASDGRVITQFLPADYCRTRTFDQYGNHVVEMNFKYFDDNFTDATQRELILKQLPKEFTTCYNNCTNRRSNIGDDKNYQWQQLDPKYARATTFSLDGTPYFVAVFPELIDYMSAKEMSKLSSELDLFTILVQKAEFDKEGNLLVDDEVMDTLADTLAKIAKSAGAGSFTTPFNIEALRLKTPTEQHQDYVGDALTSLYNSASLQEMTFNSANKNGGSAGITTNNQMSGGIFTPILAQFRRWYVSKFMEVSPSTIFDIDFLPITVFNEKDVSTEYKEMLAMGGSVFYYSSSIGINQFKFTQMIDFEESLGIKQKLVPPQTSYTTTGEGGEAGRPEKDESETSDITKDQKDKNVDKSRARAEK